MEKVSAAALLGRFWDGVLPVRPEAVAEALGIQVVPLNTVDVGKGLSGALHWYPAADSPDRQLYCRFNLSESRERQRFTIAHEIGHFASGHLTDGKVMFRDTKEVFTKRVYDPQEAEANRFAAELLMPEALVKSAIQSDGIRTVQQLAGRFLVSESAMRWRLVNLGLLSSV